MTTALGSEFVVDETAHINVARWVCLFTVVSVTPALLLVSGVDFSTHLEPLMPGHLDTLSAEALDVLANAALRGNYIHTLLEWTAATSAIFIFALALGKYRLDRQSSLLVIGVALVCAGAMDAFHTLAANGLISSAAASQHLVPFTWTICRMFHSCIQLAGVGIAVFAFRRTSKPLGIPALLLISGAFILLAYSIVAYCANSASLPQTMFPDNIVKRPFDLLPLLPNLILGFVLYPIFIRQRRNVFGYMLALALIPDTAAQLYIAFGSGALHDSAFNIAHGLKALSYLVPATGLFIDYVWTYRSLEGATARFRSQRSDLQAAMSRAEAASEAKSSFLAHMSHEIRTPLTGIVGYADLLERSAGDPADRAAWTRQLQRNSQHLLSLVNDILDLSKIEADEMAIHLGRHSIVDIIEDVASLMSPQADEKLLNFDLSFRGAMPVEIETDPVRIRQILINLSSNAIKFTDSGSIGLGARSISDPESKRTRLEIWVKDTGIGIAPEFHSEIFSAFSQVDRDSGLPSGGTGLGLGISSRIADMLGGEVRVESALGMGSTFTLSLDLGPTADVPFDRPPRRQPVLRAAPENPVEIHLDRARILVVDDGQDNQRIIAFLLEEAGAEVFVANDGASGVAEALRARSSDAPYQLILMDLQMPLLNGYEATSQLRELGFEIPIVAITAFATARDRENCNRGGFDDFICKPIVPDHFLGTVMRQLQGRRSDPRPETAPAEDLVSTMAGNPRFRSVLRQYVEAIPETIELIDQAQQRGDHEGLLRLVHQTKGAAGSYGYPGVTELADQCQRRLRGGETPDEVSGMIKDLVEMLGRIRIDSAPSDDPLQPGSSMHETG